MNMKESIENSKHESHEVELILSSLNTGLSVINSDHTISWVNKKTYEMFPEGDPIGKICHRFYESSDEPCEHCPTIQCFKSGRVHELEKYNPVTKRWYRIISQPLKYSDGQVVSVLEGVTEITERKQMEKDILDSQKNMASVLNNTQDLVVRIDRNFRHIFANTALYAANGLSPEQYLGKTNEEIGMPDELCTFWREKHDKVFQSKEPEVIEFSFPTVNKGERVFQAIISPELADNNEVKTIVSFMRDITNSKQVEEALQESKKRLAEAQKTARLGHFVFDARKDSWVSSYQLNNIFGIDKNFRKNTDSWLQIIHPDYRETMTAYFQKNILTQHQSFDKEYKIINKKTGQEKWVHGLGKLKFDKNNNLVELFGTIQDITERKQTEEALRKSEMLLKDAQKVAHIGHWELDPSTGIPVWSDEIFRIFGLNPNESEPSFTKHETYIHPDDWPILEKAIEKGYMDGSPFDLVSRIVRPSGEIGWIHSIGTALISNAGKVIKIFGTAQDITMQAQAEDKIKYSKLQFEAVLNNLDSSIYIIDMKSNEILFMNQHMKNKFGKDLTGKICWQVIHNNQDGPCEFCTNDKLIDADGISKKPYVWEFYNQNLQQWYELRDQAIPWTDGRLVRMEIATNITDRKQADKLLRESEERLDLAIKGARIGLWDWNVQTSAVVFNERWAKIVGYTLEELFPISINTWTDLCHPDDLKKSGKLLEEHFAGKTDYYICEARMRHKEGHWVWVIDMGKVFEWSKDGKPLRTTGIHIDITEHKHLEEEREKLIKELQKAMSEIKTLSGLLPICASCKKIRDDKGYWNQIEGYIQKHSDAKFSHGMCPDCSDELYGKEDWYIEMKKENEQKK